jgi:uncharacterized protein (TIGR02757 family)
MTTINLEQIKDLLDEKVKTYNNASFIKTDPIQIPHRFSTKEDIEIAAFLTASLSWGKRSVIIDKSNKLMSLMGNAPHDFVLNHSESDLAKLSEFAHRTFNGTDCAYFIKALQNIYINHHGMENIFSIHQGMTTMHDSIIKFRTIFLEKEHWIRTRKHVPDPRIGSASKRLHMFLRWMVRNDTSGVDFGLWKHIPMSKLSCPLDVHTGNVARSLGLIQRHQNDLRTVNELDEKLRSFDPIDPVRYDFALFGLGVHEGF